MSGSSLKALRAQAVLLLIVAATVVCTWLTAYRLHVSTDLSALFPDSGDAAALSLWTRAFGGRDPALLLVRGDRPDDVERVAAAIADALRHASSIEAVVDHVPLPESPPDPTLAWAYGGPLARARLAQILTHEGMRARLAETRDLLLAPAGDPMAEAWLARDPLRLSQVPWESRAELAGGVGASGAGAFVADGGKARLVLAQPRGSAFVSADAEAVMNDVDAAIAASAVPGVTVEVSGGHAISHATEEMMKRDLEVSGTLSFVLAAVAFVVTFRRVRALVAVLPPLIIGTLWTTGLAALFPAGLSAIAIAFAAVVVGVGVDTGVHVYAAFLDARRAGHEGARAVRVARNGTAGPTLTAATVAAVAFASLGLSGLRAMKQLGLLCGAGELLTAVAIVLITPEIAAWLERKPPPPAPTSAWIDWVARATSTRRGAVTALVACGAPIALLGLVGWPRPADALVAVRPHDMPPFVAQQHVQALFGGSSGQRFVLTIDGSEAGARARADRLAETLEGLEHSRTIDGYDALATFAPGIATQRARLAERDRLDLPARRPDLEAALREAGFDLDTCAPALDAFSHPASEPPSVTASGAPWLFSRHLAHDDGKTVIVTYVRTTGDPAADRQAAVAIMAADPLAVVTGFDAIDHALRDALDRDLVLVGGVALVVVALAMRLALKSLRHALVALATLACEMGVVGVAMRLLAVRWHVYDALVLPVLFGVTVDESMFLLHAARERSMAEALRTQGPLVAATALTTAAGFGALIACRFDGLRDLGAVGAIGVLAGLIAALVVVPAGLRLIAPSDAGVTSNTRTRKEPMAEPK
jgi:predicted RND superfamily exporter protein